MAGQVLSVTGGIRYGDSCAGGSAPILVIFGPYRATSDFIDGRRPLFRQRYFNGTDK